jgi:hypothetical protein
MAGTTSASWGGRIILPEVDGTMGADAGTMRPAIRHP